MRVLLAAVGRSRRGPEADLAEHYLDRARKAGQGVSLRPVELIEAPESGRPNVDNRRSEEAASLLALVPAGAVVLALDERGETWTSEAFAAQLARWRDAGTPSAAFLIGGPDGHGAAARAAGPLLSLGPMTWPHLLVRGLMLEQVYRAATILSGHPYHRGS